ncbi:MAG: hypothetical protein [Caudoviricetes sp.]|nr:MAG: hypothetical protein [Caudoviricetes sp.]
MTNDMKTLNPGQIITITEGFYRNALGVYKVLKPITKDVIYNAHKGVVAKIQQEDLDACGEIMEVHPDEYMDRILAQLIVMGYLEKIDAVEIFLGDSEINPETFEA